MIEMTPGITRANEGMDGIRWTILGQIYIPKQLSAHSFSWHATFPTGTFVPPHIHPRHDEFVYMLEGKLDLLLDVDEASAEPGDFVRLPMGHPDGIFNKTDQDVKCLFWVSPSGRLYDLFWAIHDMGPDADPADLVARDPRHGLRDPCAGLAGEVGVDPVRISEA